MVPSVEVLELSVVKKSLPGHGDEVLVADWLCLDSGDGGNGNGSGGTIIAWRR